MKYFLDTEFLEGTQKSWFGRNTKPTIDLISIGIVAEDGREYYAISKDFNLKEAWSRFQLEDDISVGVRIGCLPNKKKVYWIRENVLKNLFINPNYFASELMTYKEFKKLINKYGKSNKQIAEEINEFTNETNVNKGQSPKFYGYYADYDWVVFCWLFGKMIDLPKGFPMYCIDLKQTLDEKAESLTSFELSKLAHTDVVKHNVYSTYDTGVLKCSKTDLLKTALKYPKQTNKHNALADAKWNFELYKFLEKL